MLDVVAKAETQHISKNPYRLRNEEYVPPLERMQEVGHAVSEVYIRYVQRTTHYTQNGVRTLRL